jgi:hypothetical protein
MNKSKHSVYLIITVAIILFFLGNWVTSAQATSAGMAHAEWTSSLQ